MGKIGVLLIGLTIFAWLSIATLLYAYFKYAKDYDTVQFSNMLFLPQKYNEHRKAMGDRHIERGIAAIEDQKFLDGIRLLRLGLARSPEICKAWSH